MKRFILATTEPCGKGREVSVNADLITYAENVVVNERLITKIHITSEGQQLLELEDDCLYSSVELVVFNMNMNRK
jgi:hypothetical protein